MFSPMKPVEYVKTGSIIKLIFAKIELLKKMKSNKKVIFFIMNIKQGKQFASPKNELVKIKIIQK